MLGVPLPVDPCTYAKAGIAAAYWLGPDEWLLSVAPGSEAEVEGRLRNAAVQAAVTDVSGAYVLFRLGGRDARSVMMKSGPYDYRLSSDGRCVGTVFAKATALVALTGDGTYDIFVRRSYAHYAGLWIADAAAEYGFAE